LFAYTGGASLAAKAAGADVTHLDSVRQVVTWARENMERSGLDGIRWVVEDALKFARREARRGNLYQGIILDPPAYGHGPDGEKWKLDELLFDLLKNVAQILAPRDSFLVLNLYSNGYSATLGETVCREAFKTFRELESGELALRDEFGKVLPLSIFVRLKR
ncbi:MAG: class I SAM-dependent methyltransferase, partial [Clostridia bacterium]|nr:class I SAM-dependent methyltransferase [Clostridia bacterium]